MLNKQVKNFVMVFVIIIFLKGENYAQESSRSFSPYTLSYFTVTVQKNGTQVLIEWETAAETNLYHFEVERSIDSLGTYERIGRTDAFGTTMYPKYYFVVDENPYTGKSYYRLKGTDFDGTFRLSNSVGINIGPQAFIPNAFTPNGDGTNDEFKIYGNAIESINLKIFNRWGKLVFETDDKNKGWDGTYQGRMQTPDVYVWVLSGTYIDGNEIRVNKRNSGTLVLIR